MTRYMSALFFGLLVSLTLFWFMQFMILNNQQGLSVTDPVQMVEFVRLKRDTKLETKSRKQPEPPPPPEKRPPPPEIKSVQPQINQIAPNMDMPNLDLPVQSRLNSSLLSGVQAGAVTGAPGPGSANAQLIPLVLIQPRYPMRAKSRRIEGWVKVVFTVTETGEVADPRVTDSHPKNVFDRAALRAIAKWKFKPQLVDGKAVAVPATKTLQFKLSK